MLELGRRRGAGIRVREIEGREKREGLERETHIKGRGRKKTSEDVSGELKVSEKGEHHKYRRGRRGEEKDEKGERERRGNKVREEELGPQGTRAEGE